MVGRHAFPTCTVPMGGMPLLAATAPETVRGVPAGAVLGLAASVNAVSAGPAVSMIVGGDVGAAKPVPGAYCRVTV